MATIRQKSAFPPGKYRVAGQPRIYTRDDLAEYVKGTRAAMAAGIAVPLLKKHAPPGADDAVTTQFSATDGAGWLKGIEQDADGALEYELDVPDDIKADLDAGKIKFTTPEFRTPYIDGKGRNHGKAIRHIAFTHLPRNPDQGKFEAVAMGEGIECVQCSQDDFEGPPDDKGDKSSEGDGDKKPDEKNPDSPPKATDKSKNDALRECFSVLGAELTSDWSMDKDGAVDELLAALKTLAKAKQDAEAAKEKQEPKEPNVTESQNTPFSEDEITALPPAMQTKARKANADAQAAAAQAVQFAEERATVKRKEAAAAVKAAKLPPALRKQLLGMVEDAAAVQFSEEGEQPTLTIQKAAELFAAAIPPSLQFAEGDLTDAEHPDGETFFKGDAPPTAEEAEATARRIHSRNKSAAPKAA